MSNDPQLSASNTPVLDDGNDTLALPADDTPALAASSVSGDDDLDSVSSDVLEDVDDYTPLVGGESTEAQVAQAEQFGEELMATQNIIHRYSNELDELTDKLKSVRESMKNLLDNDAELQELEAKTKTATQDLRNKKQRVKESPEAVQLAMKAKEIQEEKKEIEETLRNHLLRYYQLTGSQVIEEPDGSEREISINARLKGKKRAD